MLPQFQQLSLLRKFSLDELARLTDTEILQLFRAARWGQSDNPNEVVFPHCGKRHRAFFYLVASGGVAPSLIADVNFLSPVKRHWLITNFPLWTYWLLSTSL
jgi:hypothetical protein